MALYEHDSNDFEQFAEGIENEIKVNVQLPPAETLVVRGIRDAPTIIQINGFGVERNPKRDARMLSAFLSTALDKDTLVHLSEYLYFEHLAPALKEQQDMLNTLFQSKKSSKKKKENPPDEAEDL